ncbi:hypothetical protein [Maritalea myrionectae]|uniref:hypothetical protein n=1 Tax=Maritalea myrionectae TaxID=454601 RepID=UPI0003F5E396|nr:hypothetical protein [Maritalea myrionectae]
MSPRAISSLAKTLSIFLLIASILIPVMFFAFVVFANSLELSLLGNATINLQADDFTPTMRAILGLFALGYLTPLLVGFAGLRQTFDEAAAGRWLSAMSVAGFQRFAWANLALLVYEIFGGAFLVTYVRLQQVPNQISFMFGLTTEFFTALFIALAILVVAHIFAAGRNAYEENQTFV